MQYLLDTSVAIHVRDGDENILALFGALPARPYLSVLTRIELEGGIYASPAYSDRRRAGVAALLEALPVLDFSNEMAEIYGRILQQAGFSRRKIIDRMIAATAIAEGLTLITVNARDFRDVRGLAIEEWTTGILNTP